MIIYNVETGEGLDESTAYVSIEDASTILESSGGATDDWSLASETKKQQAINTASSYIDDVYGTKFSGLAKSKTQGLEWPRVHACRQGRGQVASDIVPTAVKESTAILAERSLFGNLYEIDETLANANENYPVKSISQSVATLNEAKTFAITEQNVSTSDVTRHKDVYNKLRPYMFNQKLLLRG